MIFCELQKLIYQYFLQISHLAIELIINLRQQCLVGQFRTTSLDNAGEQTFTDNHTLQRRRCLQRRIFHITSLITEYGTKQLFFRRRVRLAFRSNLTNQNITRLDTGTYTHNTILVKVFGSLFTYIRNIRSQLFHTALRFTNFQRVFLYVYGSQKVFANHTFVQYDSVLIVVSLPRHVGNQQVLTQSKLALFGRVTLGKDLSLRHTLTFLANRTKVNRHVLVGTTPFGNSIFFQCRFEAYKLFLFRTIVQNADSRSIYKVNHTFALSSNLRTRVTCKLTFDTCTYNRSFTLQQRNCLAHHVRSHQRTVSIVMFQERNQRCCNRGNLLWRYVHQLYLIRSYNRIIGILTGFYFVADESSVFIQRCITLSDNLLFFFFGCKVNQTFI